MKYSPFLFLLATLLSAQSPHVQTDPHFDRCNDFQYYLQNAASQPDGRGEATEMLNCLCITDVCQIPGYLYPARIAFLSDLPDSYLWARSIYESLADERHWREINSVSEN